jgi:hypothetical protein
MHTRQHLNMFHKLQSRSAATHVNPNVYYQQIHSHPMLNLPVPLIMSGNLNLIRAEIEILEIEILEIKLSALEQVFLPWKEEPATKPYINLAYVKTELDALSQASDSILRLLYDTEGHHCGRREG